MIRFENFNFTYEGSSHGLHDINLAIAKGELIVLTGPSGCGKTTLTRCINGLIPDFYEGDISGKCTVCGLNIEEHETGDLSPQVGSVFQDPRSQFFTTNVRTELPFPGENLGLSQRVLQENLSRTVSELSLTPLYEKSLFTLSSGEKQKVATASVYAAGVSVYVLDEPSANLDTDGTKQLQEILRTLKSQGKTIVVSEHRLHYLKELADRVVCMENGRIKQTFDSPAFASLPSGLLADLGLRQTELTDIHGNIPIPAPCEQPVRMETRGLEFHYFRQKSLWHNLSFSCGSNEIIGIIGKNGAGKTTLFRVLMGLEKPSSGKILINGRPSSKKDRRRRSFCAVQDVDYQLITGSVSEELRIGHEKEPDIEDRIRGILKTFSLEDYADSHPLSLSGGQKQRLSIALACMSGKKFLFFDEPTSGLDAENMKLVRKEIIRQAADGCICFVITHDYEFAASLFTSALSIDDDGLVHQIPKEDYSPSILTKYYQ